MTMKTDATARALEALTNLLPGIPKEQRDEFIQAFACLSIGLMRGTMGDTFTHGFLTAAMNDLGKPAHVFAAPVSH